MLPDCLVSLDKEKQFSLKSERLFFMVETASYIFKWFAFALSIDFAIFF